MRRRVRAGEFTKHAILWLDKRTTPPREWEESAHADAR